jgi:hypothetical protein
MSNELLALLERTKNVVMTDEERIEQASSFAFGNVSMENPEVTRDTVRRASERLRQEQAPEPAREAS